MLNLLMFFAVFSAIFGAAVVSEVRRIVRGNTHPPDSAVLVWIAARYITRK